MLDLCRSERTAVPSEDRVNLARGPWSMPSRSATPRPHHPRPSPQRSRSQLTSPVSLVVDVRRLIQVSRTFDENAAKYRTRGAIGWPRSGRPRVVAAVRDNGMGIAPDLLLRNLDLFRGRSVRLPGVRWTWDRAVRW